MNTAINLMNSPAEHPAASSQNLSAADQRAAGSDDGNTDIDKSRDKSPFADILKKESGSKADRRGEPLRSADSGSSEQETGTETADVSTEANKAEENANGTALPAADKLSDPNTAAGATSTLMLQADPNTAAGATSTLLLQADPALQEAPDSGADTMKILTVAAADSQAGSSDVSTATGDNKASTTISPDSVNAASTAATTLGGTAETADDSSLSPDQAAKPLTITRIHQGQIYSSSESLTVAGNTLPSGGKNLPAGVFFNSEGSAETALRFSDAAQPGQSTGADARSDGKQNPGLALEFGADNLLRSLVSGKAGPAPLNTEAAPLAAQPASTAMTDTAAPPLLNPSLQVSGDKALTASRSPLLPGLEASTQFTINAEAGSSEWGNQLSSRIRWMGNLNLSSAELRLHPAELGTVEIQITTEDDQTRVSFVTSNAAAKEIIENSLPRLRDLLSEGGLQLQQGDVAHQEAGDQKASGDRTGDGSSAEDAAPEESMLHINSKSTSQIDHYV